MDPQPDWPSRHIELVHKLSTTRTLVSDAKMTVIVNKLPPTISGWVGIPNVNIAKCTQCGSTLQEQTCNTKWCSAKSHMNVIQDSLALDNRIHRSHVEYA